MAIWKEQTTPPKEPAPMPAATTPSKDDSYSSSSPSYNQPPARSSQGEKETLIAANLAIEGKIQGSGHVRVAGQFKGDVNVDGNLTIEQGAKVIGGVRASTVTIAGELEGNVDAASRVELLATGVLNGDVKAGSLTVAAGSRMRGNAEFGWEETEKRPASSSTSSSTSSSMKSGADAAK
ncbi:MAG: polymer-forming cytoskeletal protein [Gemmatimonadaceae bacterium]